MVDGIDAAIRQAQLLYTALGRLRRTVETAMFQNEGVQEQAIPLQFRMEGTGRRVLGKAAVITDKLGDILELVDDSMDDVMRLEEALQD